jgi:hypothetical protein
MKMAGAPLGKGPTKVPGARKLWPRSVAMISTRISPIVMIRAIDGTFQGDVPSIPLVDDTGEPGVRFKRI